MKRPTKLRQKPGPKGIPDAKLKAALKKNAGVFALAARDLGIDRSAVWHRVDRSPELQAWVAAIEEEVADAAEAVIKGQIVKGDAKVARWYLQTKGKSRGYTTRQEVTGADGAPLPAPSVHVVVSYTDGKEDVV